LRDDRDRAGSLRKEAEDQPLRIAFFGYDRTDSTVLKRSIAFAAAGADVVGFMFHRLRGLPERELPFPNVDLGTTSDMNYLKRLPRLAMALARIVREASVLRRSDVIYARNLDMLALGVASRALTWSRATIVYEVLDIHRMVLGSGVKPRAVRMIERWLMARSALLVVSSPAFMDHYFRPLQHFAGAWHLIENKLHASQIEGAPPRRPVPPAPQGQPWVIGWFGVLRCRRSLDILASVARALGDRVQITIRGIPSENDVPLSLMEEVCGSLQNVTFGGPYAGPAELPDIYGGVHLVWAADFLDAGSNSDWLLPNRIYEGGYFGVPALVRTGTATADKVEKQGLGWALGEPAEDGLIRLLRELDPIDYGKVRSHIECMERSAFVDISDTDDLLSRIASLARVCDADVARSAVARHKDLERA